MLLLVMVMTMGGNARSAGQTGEATSMMVVIPGTLRVSELAAVDRSESLQIAFDGRSGEPC